MLMMWPTLGQGPKGLGNQLDQEVLVVLTSSLDILGFTSSGSFTLSSHSSTFSWDDKDEDQYGLKEVVNESMEVVSGKRVDVRVSCTDNVESVLQLKCRAITKKDKPPPITLLSYLWVDDKVGTYFILYSDNLSILHFINYARVCPFVDDDFSPIHLCACRNDTFANPNWVFLAKEKSVRGDRLSIGETTNVSMRYDDFPEDNLTNTKKCNLTILATLPLSFPAKPIITLYKSSIVMKDLRDIVRLVGMDALNYVSVCIEVRVIAANAIVIGPVI
ncbi:hypothetical protein GmHk_18G052724 [Glycine max]|nr:hypothetical protein GmHk_18G052724 [Glycine max]